MFHQFWDRARFVPSVSVSSVFVENVMSSVQGTEGTDDTVDTDHTGGADGASLQEFFGNLEFIERDI